MLRVVVAAIAYRAASAEEKDKFSPVEYANILAGSFTKGDVFSTGNTLPLVGRPWGFNHWAIQTNDGQSAWWSGAGVRRRGPRDRGARPNASSSTAAAAPRAEERHTHRSAAASPRAEEDAARVDARHDNHLGSTATTTSSGGSGARTSRRRGSATTAGS
jgi:hypothetical protein